MSYDQLKQFIKRKKHVSQSLWNRAMSYDEGYILTIKPIKCLNPFGTGQCLTTEKNSIGKLYHYRLNPFGTGQCLTTMYEILKIGYRMSQSLWNRAMSYDFR